MTKKRPPNIRVLSRLRVRLEFTALPDGGILADAKLMMLETLLSERFSDEGRRAFSDWIVSCAAETNRRRLARQEARVG